MRERGGGGGWKGREKDEGMGGCAWMLVGKVERLVSEAKSNYMHKARAAGRNYHKDRVGIEDTRAREGTEILYTWINPCYISLEKGEGGGRGPGSRDSPTAVGIRFCLLSSLREWPRLASSILICPVCLPLSIIAV